MSLPRRYRRLALAAALCLLGGATVNIAIAWLIGCCGASPSLSNYGASGSGWPAPPPAGWPEPDIWGESHSLGLSLLSASQNLVELARTRRQDPSVVCYFMSVDRYGLPLRSMRARFLTIQTGRAITVIDPSTIQAGLDLPRGWNPGQYRFRRIPLEPVWPGFAINTVFYAAVIAGPWTIAVVLRRRSRIRRGRCLVCGYDLTGNTSGVCPECGSAARPA